MLILQNKMYKLTGNSSTDRSIDTNHSNGGLKTREVTRKNINVQKKKKIHVYV